MMRTVVAGLLAAAALVPAVALAQDGSVRDAMRARMQARVEQARAAQVQRPQARPERPAGNWQRGDARRPQQARPDRPRPAGWQGGERSPRRDDAARPSWQDRTRDDRPDRDPGSASRPREGAGTRAPQNNWQDRNRDGRPDRTPGASWQDRNGDGRPDAARPRPDWQDRDRDGRPDRRDWNRDRAPQGLIGQGRGDRWDDRDRRDWNDNRDRGDRRGWNRGGYGERRAWNRDWRRDTRYDWNRYRATNRAAYRLPRYYAPYGWNSGYRRFGIGATLSTLLFAQSYWIADPWAYRLPEAYEPYQWVRYYNDALLVDTYTGEVVDVIHDMFW